MESGALDDRSVVNIRCAPRNAVNEYDQVDVDSVKTMKLMKSMR